MTHRVLEQIGVLALLWVVEGQQGHGLFDLAQKALLETERQNYIHFCQRGKLFLSELDGCFRFPFANQSDQLLLLQLEVECRVLFEDLSVVLRRTSGHRSLSRSMAWSIWSF